MIYASPLQIMIHPYQKKTLKRRVPNIAMAKPNPLYIDVVYIYLSYLEKLDFRCHVCPLSGIKGSNYPNYSMLHQPGLSIFPPKTTPKCKTFQKTTNSSPSSPHHLPKSSSLLIILNTHNPKQLLLQNLSLYPLTIPKSHSFTSARLGFGRN